MISTDEVWRGWLQAGLTGSIVLAVGSVAVAISRAPVHRVRLAIWTLVGSGVAPLLMVWPGIPRWSPSIWPTEDTASVVRPPVASWVQPTPWRDPEPDSARTLAQPEPIRSSSARAPVVAPHDPRPWVMVVWLLGGVGWLGWWCWGQWLLDRVVRSAGPVNAAVREHFLQIAGSRGARVRLLASDRVRLPITCTWLQPTILLPVPLTQMGESGELRFALAHEWSHVERRDYRAWTLVSLLGTLWCCHPLYWFLRRQLRLSQDFLADDRAARTGSPTDFAAYLVRLARTRLDRPQFPLPALGISGRRSQLARRVGMLLADRLPHATRCRPLWTGTVAACAALVLVAAASVRLDAAPRLDEPRQTPVTPDKPHTTSEVISKELFASDVKKPKQTAPADLLASSQENREWVGKVVDKVTGRPVSEAHVQIFIWSRLSEYSNETRLMRELHLVTLADGLYRFIINPEEASQRLPVLGFHVEQSDHVRHSIVYDYPIVLRLLDQGIRPGFELIELWTAKAVEGLVVTPEGKPAAGVQVRCFTTPAHDTPPPASVSAWVTTDARGRFRLPIYPTGSASIRVFSEAAAPLFKILGDGQRGDLGTMQLVRGIRIKGRVIDSSGEPMPNRYVEAVRIQAPTAAPNGSLLSTENERSVVTLGDGTFSLDPLPPGSYELSFSARGPNMEIIERTKNRVVQPASAAFLPRILTIEAGKEPAPITIEPTPHVVVTAQMFDSRGQKSAAEMDASLYGSIDGKDWSCRVDLSSDGLYTMVAPKGLCNAVLWMGTNNEAALLHRKSKGESLNSGSQILLGRLDQDRREIEVVHYLAPKFVVKGLTKDGKVVRNLSVSFDYLGPEGRIHSILYANGMRKNVKVAGPLEEVHHWLSRNPLTYEVEVKVTADGFAPASRKISLPEGKTEEVAFVLEPK